jgi:hypothetical protein
MSWYVVEINEPALLGGSYHRLCRQFQQAFIAASAPGEMAMFVQSTQGDVRRVFLSPGSLQYIANLVEDYEGRSCSPPDIGSVILVYGTPEAFSQLTVSSSGGDGAVSARDAIISVSEGSIRVNGRSSDRSLQAREVRATELRATNSEDDASVQ